MFLTKNVDPLCSYFSSLEPLCSYIFSSYNKNENKYFANTLTRPCSCKQGSILRGKIWSYDSYGNSEIFCKYFLADIVTKSRHTPSFYKHIKNNHI